MNSISLENVHKYLTFQETFYVMINVYSAMLYWLKAISYSTNWTENDQD